MTLGELLEQLEELRDEVGEDVEVRLMTQQSYSFENDLLGVCSSTDMGNDSDEDEVVYLVEGDQLGYGDKTAWDCVR
jgi:hypothetical protein